MKFILKYTFSSAILFLSAVFLWCIISLYINLSPLLTTTKVDNDSIINVSKKGTAVKPHEPLQATGNNNGHYETIEQTITRIKRDVVVTGTILGTPGKESALFQIEGMPDSSFYINTQLMDGFIVKEITRSYVVLKNQVGYENFKLYLKIGHGT